MDKDESRVSRMARSLHLALAGILLFPAGAVADPVSDGRTIAVEACSACHQVTPEQVLPPPVADPNEAASVAAPRFDDIAQAHGDDAEYLRKFILTPHYPMREQQWTEADLKAIVAYIQSLNRDAR